MNNKKFRAMRDAYLESVFKDMANDKKIIFICADFGSPVLDKIRSVYPDRFFNVGIAEQNLINIASGMALEGFRVYVYAIAPFITMRCYEQIRVNLALLSIVRKMSVTLIGVGAGFSYVVSGPTHQCYEDLSIMRALPNIEIYSPSDECSAEAVYEQCRYSYGIKYIRLDAQILPSLYKSIPNVKDGFCVFDNAHEITIVSTGFLTHTALEANKILKTKGLGCRVIDLISITNFSVKEMISIIRNSKLLLTLEEGFEGRGGIDSIFYSLIHENKLNVEYIPMGVNPKYSFDILGRKEMHEKVGIGLNRVLSKIENSIYLKEGA